MVRIMKEASIEGDELTGGPFFGLDTDTYHSDDDGDLLNVSENNF